MPRGNYIVVDGLASGLKAKLIRNLAAELEAQHQPVRIFSKNGVADGLTTQSLRRIITDDRYAKSPQTRVLVSAAELAENLSAISTQLEAGITCIADYSYLGALVYEYYGQAKPMPYEQVNDLMSRHTSIQPDKLIVLDTPASQSTVLASNRDLTHLERLRAGYLWEANQRSLPVIFASDDQTQVMKDTWQALLPVLAPDPERSRTDIPLDSVADVLASRQTAAASLAEPPATFASGLDQQAETQTIDHLEYLALLGMTAETKIRLPAYEKRDQHNHYHFYIPSNLTGKTRSLYIKTMNQLFNSYADMFAKLTAYLSQAANPAESGTRTKAWRQTAQAQARTAARMVLPVASTLAVACRQADQALEPRGPQPELQKLTNEFSPSYSTGDPTLSQLIDYAPHNELQVANTVLYSLSDVPQRQLASAVAAQPYQRKVDVLTAFFGATNGQIRQVGLTDVHYDFEFVTACGDMIDLTKAAGWQVTRWQSLTPRLGYATPELVEAAGLSDDYDHCFDISLELHSALQAAGMDLEAQYATLLGHKQRWQASTDIAAAIRLAGSQGMTPPQEEIARLASEAICEVHPLLAKYSGLVEKSLRLSLD